MIQGRYNELSLGIQLPKQTNKKGYKLYHPPPRQFFISMDVTFVGEKKKLYFTLPYLQGEIHKEDKDPDLSLLDFEPSPKPVEIRSGNVRA